jgi:hypothetical protein
MVFSCSFILSKQQFMEQDKKKIKEPYPPENTPSPPQIIDPSGRKEKNEDDRPIEGRPQNQKETDRQPVKKDQEKTKKLLGESETEIDDETTI